MPAADLVDRLAGHKTVGAAPREELTWLASHGGLRQLQAGQVLTAKGTPPAGLFVVLSGSLAMSVDRGAGPRKIMEWREGDVTGLLPYSRWPARRAIRSRRNPLRSCEVHARPDP